jgi:hypothetical protein
MQKITAISNHYKFKLQIIRERELLMSKKDFENKDWFPNFLILCKPIIEGKNTDSETTDSKLNGLLREMQVQKNASDDIYYNVSNLNS